MDCDLLTGDLFEVIPHRRKVDRVGKHGGIVLRDLTDKLRIGGELSCGETAANAHEGRIDLGPAPGLSKMPDRLEVPEQGQAAAEVILQGRVVERGDHPLVSVDQCAVFQLRPEVERHGIGSERRLQKPALRFHALVHVRALQGGQQIDGGHGNAGLLDEIDLGIEHALVVAIQAQDEPALDLHAALLDLSDGVVEVVLLGLVRVLLLLGFEQSLGVGGFDTDEHGVEAGLDHGIHHRVHQREVRTRFRDQGERISPGLLPPGYRRQQLQGVPLVADEVVVNQKNRPSPAQAVQRIQLLHDLFRRLGTRHAAVELDDVAKLAVERTSPGELHAHRGVVLDVDEIEPRNRRPGHVRLPRFPIHSLGRPAFQIPKEFREGLLDLVQHEMVHAPDFLVKRGRMRSSGDHRNACAVAALDHGAQRHVLRDHRGREHQIRPLEIGVMQVAHVHVDHAQLIARGKHRGDGQQPQRRMGRLDPRHLQRVVGAPVGRRVFRVNQQSVWHDRVPPRSSLI